MISAQTLSNEQLETDKTNKKGTVTSNLLCVTSKGFTLIELLVVIAIIGVLAGAIIVAIDPAEQIARANDAGRKTQAGQLADAMQTYIVAQGLAAAPAAGTSVWQTTLFNGGEIKRTFTAPSGATACAPAANNQTGYCYAPNGAAGNYLVWTFLQSKAEIDKAAGAAQTCAVNTAAAFIYDSAQGKGGNACTSKTAIPAAGLTLY